MLSRCLRLPLYLHDGVGKLRRISHRSCHLRSSLEPGTRFHDLSGLGSQSRLRHVKSWVHHVVRLTGLCQRHKTHAVGLHSILRKYNKRFLPFDIILVLVDFLQLQDTISSLVLLKEKEYLG